MKKVVSGWWDIFFTFSPCKQMENKKEEIDDMLNVVKEEQEKKKVKLPEIGIALHKRNDSVIEIHMTGDAIPRRDPVILGELVQSQATGKVYMNLFKLPDWLEIEGLVLRRENTGCLEHFNHVSPDDRTNIPNYQRRRI